jgi:ribosomal-protein-alanine N-acetyltransferase
MWDQVNRFLDGALHTVRSLSGDATFWTAIGAVGTIGALVFAGRQLYLTRKIEAYKLLCEDDEKFAAAVMVAERSALARTLLTDSSNFTVIDSHVHDVLGFFEEMGLMLRKGIAPRELVWCSFSHYILRYWPTLQPFIDHDRRESGDHNYYADFEYLHNRIWKYENKKLGRKFSLSNSDRRAFLEDEVHVDLRIVAERDIEKLEEIESRSFVTDAFDFDAFQKAYEEQRTWFFVASVLDEPVGYILGSVSGDGRSGEIESVAVEPEYRRCGVGRKLIIHLLARLQREGVEDCELEVKPASENAVRLYESLGFRRTATLENYYTDGSPAHQMHKRL